MHYTNEWDARLAWASFPVFRHWVELMGGPPVFTHTGFVNVVVWQKLFDRFALIVEHAGPYFWVQELKFVALIVLGIAMIRLGATAFPDLTRPPPPRAAD